MLTPWRTVVEKLIVAKLVKKFSVLRNTNVNEGNATGLGLMPAESSSHCLFRPILTLSSHLLIDTPSGHFPSKLPIQFFVYSCFVTDRFSVAVVM
jgi:hypothetical protein